ncbi:hypothetical protein GCM10020220_096590 [Nonomuraea rubra]
MVIRSTFVIDGDGKVEQGALQREGDGTRGLCSRRARPVLSTTGPSLPEGPIDRLLVRTNASGSHAERAKLVSGPLWRGRRGRGEMAYARRFRVLLVETLWWGSSPPARTPVSPCRSGQGKTYSGGSSGASLPRGSSTQ